MQMVEGEGGRGGGREKHRWKSVSLEIYCGAAAEKKGQTSE